MRKKLPEDFVQPALPEEKEPRKALSNIGGAVQTKGDSRICKVLQDALNVVPDEQASMLHIHGFHTYTARLHPATASRLIRGLMPRRGEHLLDPFCGSGTVLAEGRVLGHEGFGVDANPLAIELAWLKTLGPSDRFLEALLNEGGSVAALAEARRETKAGPSRLYSLEERKDFDIHVLFELDGLKVGITQVRDHELRRALWLVLSAVLGKVSRSPQDSVTRVETGRRLASGFTIRFFHKKVQELCSRLAAYSALLPPNAPPTHGALGDARTLVDVADRWADLIVTSPPYASVYDYQSHHELRLRWLDLKGSFEEEEIGARRHLSQLTPQKALSVWTQDLGQVLTQVRRVLNPEGLAALIIADSALGAEPAFADDLVSSLAPPKGLQLLAQASQVRPNFHGPSGRAFVRRPRREHVLVLSRAAI